MRESGRPSQKMNGKVLHQPREHQPVESESTRAGYGKGFAAEVISRYYGGANSMSKIQQSRVVAQMLNSWTAGDI